MEDHPRRQFADLNELAANIKAHGVLQPVLVRPHPAGDDGLYELVVVMCPVPQVTASRTAATTAMKGEAKPSI
ncbi:MAG: ParB N-terminal domain-containing protein [Terriglobales bacterium]